MKWILAVVLGIVVLIAAGLTYAGWYFFSDPDRAALIKCMTDGAEVGFLLGMGENSMQEQKYFEAEGFFRQALAKAEKCKDSKGNCAECMTRIAQSLRRQKKTT